MYGFEEGMTDTVSHKPSLSKLESFVKWYEGAKPGDFYVYYSGETLHGSIIGELLQRLTFEYALKGRVYLTRKKVRSFYYDYIATKSKRVNTRLVPENYEEEV